MKNLRGCNVVADPMEVDLRKATPNTGFCTEIVSTNSSFRLGHQRSTYRCVLQPGSRRHRLRYQSLLFLSATLSCSMVICFIYTFWNFAVYGGRGPASDRCETAIAKMCILRTLTLNVKANNMFVTAFG